MPGLGPDGRARPDAPLVAVTGVTGLRRRPAGAGAAGRRATGCARSPATPTGCAGGPGTTRSSSHGPTPSDLDQIRAALAGADVAYYLIHSLGSGRRFESTDRRTALTFAQAAREGGVGRIVYLGGLYPRGRGPLPAPGVAHRGRRDPARLRRADDRAAGRGDPRVRLGVVRDDALPDRAAAGHDRAALGRQPDPADRDPRRPALPRRLGGDARRRQPGLRHRRPGRPDLPPDDAALRRRGRPAAADHRRRQGADAEAVQPLGVPRDARAVRARAAAGRVARARGGVRRARHRRASCPTRPAA